MDRETERLRLAFSSWVSTGLRSPIATDVVAFSFNLFETVDAFAIELVGASTYSPGDPDWACEEIFAYREVPFEILPKGRGNTWQNGLAVAVDLVSEYIARGAERGRLLAARAVAVGFVDGDLEVVWSGDDRSE